MALSRVLRQNYKDKNSNSELCALLSLPQHLLHALLKPVLTAGNLYSSLYLMIHRLPLALYEPLISAAVDIDESGEQSLNLHGLSPLLSGGVNRSQLRLSPPGLRSLCIKPSDSWDDAGIFTSMVNSTVSHSSLTNLELNGDEKPMNPCPTQMLSCSARAFQA